MTNMELPQELKNLYRHWGEHISRDTQEVGNVSPEMNWFIKERMNIWEKRVLGGQQPYTADPILSQYRFCNIFREFDRQTIEIHSFLNSLRDNFPLWLLNMFYCRMVARTKTIEDVGLLSFDAEKNAEVYKRLTTSSRPRYGSPYVFPISAIQNSQYPTRELFITTYLPQIIGEVAAEIETWNKVSVYDAVEKIISIFKFNLSFLWTEVCIDIAYQFPQYLDLFQRFPIGPGSLQTFKRIYDTQDPSITVQVLADKNATVGITYEGEQLRLSAENWEGIGCEYRKYTNLSGGKGRRRIYKPSVVQGPLEDTICNDEEGLIR